MTIEEETINNKKIIIPSFSTTSAIFTQHCMVLKDLKKRIDALKFSYFKQRAEDRSWELIERILDVLDKGTQFLDISAPLKNFDD